MTHPVADVRSHATPAIMIDLTARPDAETTFALPRGEGSLIRRGGVEARWFPQLHSGFAIPRHTLNAPAGSVEVWITPLDDLGTQAQHPQHRRSNPGYDQYVFLSDREAPLDPRPAQFAMYLHTYWHPLFMAKWHRGGYDELCWTRKRGAIAMAGHQRFHRDKWYQLIATWDRPAGVYRLYVNGVLVGTEDQTYGGVLPNQAAGPIVYGGSPRVGYRSVSFWDVALSAQQVAERYASSGMPVDADVQRALAAMHLGEGTTRFVSPDASEGWQTRLALPMTRIDDLLHFYHQGTNNGTTVSDAGTRVVTPGLDDYFDDPGPPGGDQTRMYFWTRQVFHGDLHVSFDFTIHRPGGLALLMTQAAGMHGEDFLHTYHPRTDGAMKMVCWEDVRNYHWEFMRQMHDVRNDVANHAMMKNPWYCPLAYRATPRPWELDRTYRLHYVQRGDHIVGAVDDTVVIDVQDTPWTNNGPVLRHGAVALRCMMRCDMTFRNLLIRTRPDEDER